MDKLFLRLNHRETNKDPNCPVLVLSVQAYRKLMFWTKYASEVNKWEVSGLGTVQPRHGGYFVSNVWLIKPEAVGAAHADMDGHGVAALMQKLFYGTGEMRETTGDNVSFVGGRDLKNLRFLWHSHNNFGVGWSGTDNKTAKLEFCQDAKWTINLNLNAMGHMIARMDFPVKNHKLLAKARTENRGSMKDTTIYELPIRLLVPIAKGQVESYRAEYEETHELKMRSKLISPYDPEEINGDADIDVDDLDTEEPYVEKPLVIPPSPGFPDDPLKDLTHAVPLMEASGPMKDFPELREQKEELMERSLAWHTEPKEPCPQTESMPDPIPDGLPAVNLFDEVGVVEEEGPSPVTLIPHGGLRNRETCTHPNFQRTSPTQTWGWCPDCRMQINRTIPASENKVEGSEEAITGHIVPSLTGWTPEYGSSSCMHSNFRRTSRSYDQPLTILQRLCIVGKPPYDLETGWCPDCKKQITRVL